MQTNRTFSCVAIATLVAVTLGVAALGCSSNSYGRLSVRRNDNLYERHGDGPVMVAFLRGDDIVGVSGASIEDLTRWPASDSEVIDHPNLGVWREQLRGLRQLAEGGVADASTAMSFTQLCEGFPFDGPIRDAATSLAKNDPAAAVELLDNLEQIDFGDTVVTDLARQALRTPVADDRLAGWIRSLLDEDLDEAVLALTRHEDFGPLSLDALLGDLDDVSFDLRGDVFSAAASRFAKDSGSARGIVAAVDDLSASDEVPALRRILKGGASPEFFRQVLFELDERPSNERLDLFEVVTDRCYLDTSCTHAIAQSIESIPSSDRADAVLHVIVRPDAPTSLVVALLDVIDEVPYGERSDVLLLAVEGPHRNKAEVLRALRRSLESGIVPRRDRERVLRALVPATAPVGR